jgi:uncharacterized protein YacL
LKNPQQEEASDKPPQIYFDPEPDPLRNNVRMGCGAVFGLLFALYVMIRLFKLSYFSIDILYIFIILAVVFICLFAYLALRQGDHFWENFFK